jgi:hypothetical protein
MSTPPVTSVTEELIAELEREARNATPGPWTADASPVGELYVSGSCDEFICGAIDHVHDANLIALASPGTILALLAERAELKRDAERYRWLIRQAWFQSAMDRYDIDDGGLQVMFESEASRIIDAAMQEPKPCP